MAYSLTAFLKEEYQQLFDSCLSKPDKYSEVDACINKIATARNPYQSVSSASSIPWYLIGVIHTMQCGGSFSCHLHNGDPLTARTVHVPKGYPKQGNPPFAWEASAVDALTLQSLNRWTDWSVPGMLFLLERYNGFGYRVQGIHSPYLWSASNQYSKGKFSADGHFDPKAISKQIGAAVLLRRMSERQIAIAGELDIIAQIKKLGEEVTFDPNVYHAQAEALQKLLNEVGLHLRTDGKAGRITSDAYFQIAGKYLTGDIKSV